MYEKQLKPFIRKIIPYILIVLITVIINNFIVQTSGNTTFVNNFNFGSTLISITLSLIAIFYTFIDGAENKIVQNKIIESASDIQKTSKDLQIINSSMSGFKETLKEVEKNIIENNSLKYTDINQNLEEISRMFLVNQNSTSKLKVNIEFKDIIPEISDFTLLILFIYAKSYQKQKYFNLAEFTIGNKTMDYTLMVTGEMLMRMNILDISIDKTCMLIKDINLDVLKIIEETLNKKDLSYDESLVCLLNFINEYF